jgi:hypothetical protein
MKKHLVLLSLLVLNPISPFSAAVDAAATSDALAPAAQTVNALGLQLLAKGTAIDSNALLSPYSIQTAFAMTFAGAVAKPRSKWPRYCITPVMRRHGISPLRRSNGHWRTQLKVQRHGWSELGNMAA